jgi:mannose-1-phosphate guanylyltransferase
MEIIPVIFSGGSGTRLWSLSRKQYSKQYLPLAGDNTMLQETILYLSGLENKTNERIEIIEVQSGTYLGEDDIVRFEDIYGGIDDD